MLRDQGRFGVPWLHVRELEEALQPLCFFKVHRGTFDKDSISQFLTSLSRGGTPLGPSVNPSQVTKLRVYLRLAPWPAPNLSKEAVQFHHKSPQGSTRQKNAQSSGQR